METVAMATTARPVARMRLGFRVEGLFQTLIG
jgi:hypothetical protein